MDEKTDLKTIDRDTEASPKHLRSAFRQEQEIKNVNNKVGGPKPLVPTNDRHC